MEIAIDTGNKQVKTDHSISISGVVPQNTIPATARPEDYIRYRGRYYTLTNKRQEYLRDKSETERYFVLAMMGIAKELDYKENHNEIAYDPDKTYYITMLGGLPPAHMEDARLKDNFKAYFKTSDAQYVWYKGRTWRVKITKVYVQKKSGSYTTERMNKSSYSKKISLTNNSGYVYVYCYNEKTKGSEMLEIRDSRWY